MLKTEKWVLILGYFSLLLAASINYWLTDPIFFIPLYTIPIVATTWYGGLKNGLITLFITVGFALSFNSFPNSNNIVAFTIQACIFAFISFLLFHLKRTNKALQLEKEKRTLNIKQLTYQKHIIEKRREELEEINEIKNKLFAIISHDLKSPLNSLKGIGTILRENKNLPEDQTQFLFKSLNDTLDNASNLLNNLLKWAKNQMAGETLSFRKLSVHAEVNECLKLLKPIALEKKIRVTNLTDIEETVWGDRELLQTVIRNVIANAVKFSFPEGIITIESKNDGDIVSIIITDFGVGMRPEVLEMLNKGIYVPSSKGTSKEKGSGIGLMLSKDFAGKMGGNIYYESILDKGTKVTVTLQASEEAYVKLSHSSAYSVISV